VPNIRSKYRSLKADWTAAFKRDYMAEYYAKRREHLKAQAKRRYIETRAQAAARYQAKREEKLQALAALRSSPAGDLMRQAQRQRYHANPGPAVARAHKRRAIKRHAAIGTDRAAYCAFVRLVRCAEVIACHWCAQPVKRADRRIDHVVPLSRGGADSVDNLCCACRLCNARKGSKLPSEWTK
jgi:5-methylcytosine-specific restriction endonuclease McrA